MPLSAFVCNTEMPGPPVPNIMDQYPELENMGSIGSTILGIFGSPGRCPSVLLEFAGAVDNQYVPKKALLKCDADGTRHRHARVNAVYRRRLLCQLPVCKDVPIVLQFILGGSGWSQPTLHRGQNRYQCHVRICLGYQYDGPTLDMETEYW